MRCHIGHSIHTAVDHKQIGMGLSSNHSGCLTREDTAGFGIWAWKAWEVYLLNWRSYHPIPTNMGRWVWKRWVLQTCAGLYHRLPIDKLGDWSALKNGRDPNQRDTPIDGWSDSTGKMVTTVKIHFETTSQHKWTKFHRDCAKSYNYIILYYIWYMCV